ncbi:hypothetical protein MTO96_049833 [Rhipicephalus appendiculatus]
MAGQGKPQGLNDIRLINGVLTYLDLGIDKRRKLTITSSTEENFVAADDDLVKCGVHTVEEIAKELSTPDALTSEEENNPGSSHDGPPPTAMGHRQQPKHILHSTC